MVLSAGIGVSPYSTSVATIAVNAHGYHGKKW